MTQQSKLEKKADKKKARLKKTVDEKEPEEISMESTSVDEPTIDSDTKQAHIERMLMTWQIARNANGKTCVLCESREQDPECAGKLCFACCDSTRIQNYKINVVLVVSQRSLEQDTRVRKGWSRMRQPSALVALNLFRTADSMMKKREWIWKGCHPLHELTVAIYQANRARRLQQKGSRVPKNGTATSSHCNRARTTHQWTFRPTADRRSKDAYVPVLWCSERRE